MFGRKGLGAVVVVVVVASACSGTDPEVEFEEAGGGSGEAGTAGTVEPGGGAGGEGGVSTSPAGGADEGGTSGVPASGDEAGSGGTAAEAAGGTSEGGTSEGGTSEGGASGGGASNDGGTENGGEGGAAPVDPLPGGNVYVPGQVLEFRFTLAEADWQHLEEHGNDETFVPASVAVSGSHLDGVEFSKVGLRHKGAWSLHHCWDYHDGVRYRDAECRKLSYKVKFSEYDEDGRLDGLKRMNLHASSGDVTKLRELVAYQTFSEAGLHAPRAVPATVTINGVLQGLFIAVEDVDGRYTKAHFPDAPDGNLYKEVWPHPNTDEQAFAAALETNEETGDVSDMVAFAAAVGRSTASTFADEMEPFVDVESILRYLAVDRAIRNWDGVTAFYSPVSPHNFFWYHEDGSDGRFQLIPWDLDNTFWDYDPYMSAQQTPPIPNINVAPLHCDPRPIWTPDNPVRVIAPRCDPFLDLLIRTRWERFVDIARELRAGPLGAERLNARVSYWRGQIVSLVDRDPTVDLGHWQTEVKRMPVVFDGMLAEFDALLDAGLREETPPVDPVPEPSQEILNAPSVNGGLLTDEITNFEFETPPDELTGIYAYGSFVAYDVGWNNSAPISGTADLLLSFTFTREPGPYNEWLDLTIASTEADIRGSEYIVVTLAADANRVVRVRAASAAYDEDFGGVWSEFGTYVTAGPTPRRFVIPLTSLTYPEWARAAWSGDNGWTVSDDEARSRVLERFTGLIFVPQATVDAAGELVAETETGSLRVDNVYFR